MVILEMLMLASTLVRKKHYYTIAKIIANHCSLKFYSVVIYILAGYAKVAG